MHSGCLCFSLSLYKFPNVFKEFLYFFSLVLSKVLHHLHQILCINTYYQIIIIIIIIIVIIVIIIIIMAFAVLKPQKTNICYTLYYIST
jgi:hypothetical protein